MGPAHTTTIMSDCEGLSPRRSIPPMQGAGPFSGRATRHRARWVQPAMARGGDATDRGSRSAWQIPGPTERQTSTATQVSSKKTLATAGDRASRTTNNNMATRHYRAAQPRLATWGAGCDKGQQRKVSSGEVRGIRPRLHRPPRLGERINTSRNAIPPISSSGKPRRLMGSALSSCHELCRLGR